MVYSVAVNFDNIEADGNVNLPARKVIFRRLNVSEFPLFVHGFRRAAVDVGQPCLDFDKRNDFFLCGNYIDFAERVFIAVFQNFISMLFKIFQSKLFALCTQLFIMPADIRHCHFLVKLLR